MIKELTFEGSNRHFDQTLCTGWKIAKSDISALCKDMKKQALKNALTDEQMLIHFAVPPLPHKIIFDAFPGTPLCEIAVLQTAR